MDFQKLLLGVGKALCKEEIKALAFLCTELLGRNLASVESASDLFSCLADQDLLSAEQPHLLTELLFIIQRTRLARDLKLTDPESTARSLISPYRKLLYSLSEELTGDDLKHVKFLLIKKLPRSKLEENVTTLEVFLEMEHMDLISHTNLELLKSIIQEVCPMLTGKIDQFKAQHMPHTSPAAPTAQPTQAPCDRTCSSEIQGSFSLGSTQSTLNSSNTSVDLPNGYCGGDECEALSHGLSGLSTKTSRCASCKGKNDTLITFSQENETPSGKQMSLNAHTNTILGTYPMAAAKRGTCLIINNYDFTKSEKGLQNREGTMVDEECLRKVFEWLGFEIETQRDCKSEKMLSVIQELAGRNHSQVDCLVCCILSHGQDGSVCGVDGRTVTIREMMESFNGLNCSSLTKKPKLFFIQACQGTRKQKPISIKTDGPARSLVCSDAIKAKDSIPSDADFLLGMATVPSFVSFRDPKNGTWFIQSLCQNLVLMVPSGFDLVSIMTKVNADVSKRTDSTGVKKQMPQPAFSLTKKVVFPIPKAPPPMLEQ